MTRWSLVLGLGLISLPFGGACSSNAQVASSSAPLTLGSSIWYPASTPTTSHPGSVSTIVANGNYCSSADGTEQVTSAWEARPNDFSGNANAIWWSIGCPTATVPAQPPMQLNVGMTGTPPEWNSGQQMVWLGQPHLVPIGPSGWVALVGLVGVADDDTQLSAHNMAIVLSTNGGESWVSGSAHLIAPVGGVLGGTEDGTPIVSDYAATAATWTNTHATHDIFVVWQSHSTSTTTWATTVGYDSSGAYLGASTPVSASTSGIFEPSIVAGTQSVIGNYVFVMGLDAAHEKAQGTLGANECPIAEHPLSQTWVSRFTQAPISASWFDGRPLVAHSWRCAGGLHDTSTSIYPVSQRVALTADPAGDRVVAASNRFRPGDATKSLSVRLTGFAWCVCGGSCSCGGGAPGGGTATDLTDSARGDVASGVIEDQINPFIAAHPVSGKGAVAWYDTAENASGNIASVHGQVQSLSSSSLVGQRIFLPSVPYAFPNDFGLYDGAAAFGNGAMFALGYVDGAFSGQPPTGQGGMYTSVATP